MCGGGFFYGKALPIPGNIDEKISYMGQSVSHCDLQARL